MGEKRATEVWRGCAAALMGTAQAQRENQQDPADTAAAIRGTKGHQRCGSSTSATPQGEG